MKIKNHKKQQRIKFIIISASISLIALTFIVFNFRDNIIFFYSPSEIYNNKIIEKRIIRVGGLVKKGTIIADGGNLQFIMTDLKTDLIIKYFGIKPNLFRENQGMVAKGYWNQKNNIFIATELLSKHDEKYMPPEVKRIIN